MIKEIEKSKEIKDRGIMEKQKEAQITLTPKELLERVLLVEFDFDSDNIVIDKETIFNIIPELKAEDGFDHKHPHHVYDVWKHTIEAMKKSEPDLQIRLALLLHDIGKPYCYQEDGEIRHFRGHPKKSAQMAKEILIRLGYSEKEIEDIVYLVENHDTIIDVKKVNKNNMERIEKQLHMQYCDAYAHHPNHIEKRIRKLNEIKEELEKKKSKIQEEQECR